VRRALIGALLGALILTAAAGAARGEPLKADLKVHVAPILPTLDITTNTDGSSTFRLGGDLLFGISHRWDLDIQPTFLATTTNGLVGLFNFSGNNGQSTPWTLGLQFAFIDLGPDLPMNDSDYAKVKRQVYQACNADPNGPVLHQLCDAGRKAWFSSQGLDEPSWGGPMDIVKIEAYEACTAYCKAHPTDKSCSEHFLTQPANDIRSVDPGDLCSEGLKIWMDKYDRPARERRGRFPSYVAAAGFSLGASQQTFLEPDLSLFQRDFNRLQDSVGTKGQVPDIPLVVHTENELEARAAFSLTYVSTSSGFTTELPLTYRYFATPSPFNATFCQPVGPVVQQMPSAMGMVTTAPAQSCQTLPLGIPTHTHQGSLGVLFGYVSKPDAFWRFSVGPNLVYAHALSVSGPSDNLLAQLQAPVYLNFANAPMSWTGSFMGVVVVTPSIGVNTGTFGTHLQLGLGVAVFARRTMFPRALEWIL
jgi:hypothetical protein